MSGLRRAIVLALACASGQVTASVPGPAVVAAPSEPLVLLPVPVPVPPPLPAPAPASEVPAAASTQTPELAPPPARAMTSGAETFARLRRNLRPDACDAGSNSARWRKRYASSPGHFSRRLQTVLPLLDFVSLEVERAGLPAEFTFIPLVESWFQPAAVGPGGPAGMWQMISSTARNHGIHIREGYDGRLSPVESTRAALSYLKVLQGMFGDWQAIVMAYNAGEGRMQRAMRRAGSRVTSAAQRRPHGLSNITYDYVDKLLALSCLVSQPQRFHLHLPMETRFEPLGPLLLDPDIQSLDAFARTLGQDPAELRRLNPSYRNGRVIAGVPRMVLAPPGISIEPAAVAATPGPLPALPFDLLVAVDDTHDDEIAELLEAALADPRVDAEALASLEASGNPRPAAAPAQTQVEASEPAPEPPSPGPHAIATSGFADPPPSVHQVREGESLWSIAKHYQLPVEQLRRANGLDNKATVQPGQVLQLVP